MYSPRPISFPAPWCAGYSKYLGFLAGGISNASSPLLFWDRGSAAKTLISQNRQLRRLPPPPPTHVLVPKKHLRMYLVIPVDIRDCRTHIFCPQRGLKNYLRSTMKQDRLNNYLLMHCHKSITDTLVTLDTWR